MVSLNLAHLVFYGEFYLLMKGGHHSLKSAQDGPSQYNIIGRWCINNGEESAASSSQRLLSHRYGQIDLTGRLHLMPCNPK